LNLVQIDRPGSRCFVEPSRSRPGWRCRALGPFADCNCRGLRRTARWQLRYSAAAPRSLPFRSMKPITSAVDMTSP
jgi:hypothetical protein